MKYRHISEAFYNQPLAILPEKLWEVETFLARKIRGEDIEPEKIEAVAAGPRSGIQVVGKVAILPLFGIVAQRMNMMMAASGGTSTEQFGAALDSLVADRAIRSILMVVDSPGGSVAGVPELASKVYQAREAKKIVAIADSMAASAAYWIASQASELVVTPSGQVGSIGVLAAHQDFSKAEEAAGIKTTIVKAGKYKAEADPSLPLSAEATDYLQETVNQFYGMFVAAVARGRGVTEGSVKGGMGQGRMVLAKDAVALGMADRVATIQQVLHRMGADEGGTSPGAAMARARAVEIECNLPTLFAFVHNSKTADKEPIWGAVDKTKLPRIAFAEKGEPDKKSTWGYPHHWVSGAGNPDDNGVWTTGTLFLHREGLNAAWAAANGARSGQKADQAVIDHLQAHRRALGLEKE